MITIVPFNSAKHKEAVSKIFHEYPDLFWPREYKQLEGDFDSGSDEFTIKLVALMDNEPAGFLEVDVRDDVGKSRQIQWLAVGSKYIHHGVATRLLSCLEEIIKKEKVERLFVETCTCQGEKPARRFYEKNGFVPLATLIDFYGAGHSDVIYQKVY